MIDGGRKADVWGMGAPNGGAPGEVADTQAAKGNSEEGGGNPLGQKAGYVYLIETEDGRYMMAKAGAQAALEKPGSRVQVSTEGGVEPMWSRDGRISSRWGGTPPQYRKF